VFKIDGRGVSVPYRRPDGGEGGLAPALRDASSWATARPGDGATLRIDEFDLSDEPAQPLPAGALRGDLGPTDLITRAV